MKNKLLSILFGFAVSLALIFGTQTTAFADMGSPDLSSDTVTHYDTEIQANCFLIDIENPSSDYWSDWSNWDYTGKAVKPAVSLKWYKDKNTCYELEKNKDYTVSYSNNVKPGTATITITGKGEVSGTYTVDFTIHGQDPNVRSVVNVKDGMKVTWKKCDYALKYDVYIADASGDDSWIYIRSTTGTSCTIPKKKLYAGNSYYTLMVTAIYSKKVNINEEAFQKTYYLSRPSVKALTSPSKKKIKATWKANKKCTGYQVQIGKSSTYKTKTTYTIKDKSRTSKTIKGLKSGKKYYVRFRTYKKSTITDTTYYSAWSASKTIKVK